MPVASGKVIVLSAVGSVTVKVVSFAETVEPSKTIDEPSIFNDVAVTAVKSSVPETIKSETLIG